jgi:DUF4097 and DUF4098 domain-containing protein YvlB
MKRGFLITAFAAFFAGLVPAVSLQAQDFQKSYPLGEGGFIRIRNVSGNVQVTGYAGDAVEVIGFKEGRDRDRVEIEDNSTEGRIDVRVRYPESGNTEASVNFEVRVPTRYYYNFEGIASVSGNVDIGGVRGQIRAETVSGNVTVTDVTGTVSASAVSGNVDVQITELEGVKDMKFSSVSGNVNVKAPPDLDAYVEMSTVSGSLRTDFPIEVIERRYGPGRSARGKLGTGQCNLRISAVSGRVYLIKE